MSMHKLKRALRTPRTCRGVLCVGQTLVFVGSPTLPRRKPASQRALRGRCHCGGGLDSAVSTPHSILECWPPALHPRYKQATKHDLPGEETWSTKETDGDTDMKQAVLEQTEMAREQKELKKKNSNWYSQKG